MATTKPCTIFCEKPPARQPPILQRAFDGLPRVSPLPQKMLSTPDHALVPVVEAGETDPFRQGFEGVYNRGRYLLEKMPFCETLPGPAPPIFG